MAGRNTIGHQPLQAGGHPQSPGYQNGPGYPQAQGYSHDTYQGQPHNVTYNVQLPTVADDRRAYPCCNCPCPGPHSPGCMFHVYEQMSGNYKMTKDLMAQFINHMNKDPKELEMERCLEDAKQEMCRQYSQQESNLPDRRLCGDRPQRPPMVIPNMSQFGGGCGGGQGASGGQGGFGEGKMQDCLKMLMGEGGAIGPESQNRKLIEDQRRMKCLWVQFMNIFDMSLDLAAEASNARWAINCRRKEDERLVCERRIEEARREWCRECRDQQILVTQTSQQGQRKPEKKPTKQQDYKYTNKPDTNTPPKAKPKSPTQSPKPSLKPSPNASPKPSPNATPKPSPNASPKPSLNASPKPSVVSKASPKPSVVSNASPKPSVVSKSSPKPSVESKKESVEGGPGKEVITSEPEEPGEGGQAQVD